MPTTPDDATDDDREDVAGAGAEGYDSDPAPDPDAGAPSRGAVLAAAHNAGLDTMTGLLREQARGWARQLTTMRDLEDLSELGAKAGQAQFPQLEMAGSWSISQITASRWQWEAERFHLALPLTLSLLATGDLLVHQATVLLHTTRECTVPVAQAVEAAVLPAGTDLCPADLRTHVQRAVLRIEAEHTGAAEQRHAQAAAKRRTYSKPLPDGMGLAGAVLTAPQLVGWSAAMDALERRERLADQHAGITRTADQRRADLFAALPAMVLAGTAQDRTAQDRTETDRTTPAAATGTAGSATGGTTGSATGGTTGDSAPATGSPVLTPWTLGPEQLAAQVIIYVHSPVSTILDLSTEPGTLDRYGPISAEHVRLLRPHSWHRLLVDADTGRPIALDHHPTPADPDPHRARDQVRAMLTPAVIADVDEPGHDPSARLARLIDLRDMHCCGPGCSSTHTDRDHLTPHPQGPTNASNLGLASRRCHRAKHHGWTLLRHPDGSTTWTSPLGRTYHRPSPHTPPPHINLWQDPPPLRPRPTALPPDNNDNNDSRWPTGHRRNSGTSLPPQTNSSNHDRPDHDPTAGPDDPACDDPAPF